MLKSCPTLKDILKGTMADLQQFLVRFWGVRGSYPTPGPRTLRHGGNTSCIEVLVGDQTLVFDAGSGIIRLGEALMQRANGQSLRVALFITHAHGDHLVGFPFFAPLFAPQASVEIFGPRLAGQTIEQIVTPLMSPPYFPVEIQRLPSRRDFYTLTEGSSITWLNKEGRAQVEATDRGVLHHALKKTDKAQQVHVRTLFTRSHPLDGALVYRIEYAGHCLVYATDVEWGQGCDPAFLSFIEGADILIHDAQYTTPDYQQSKHGYGHSTVAMAVDVAQQAHVGELLLFHHEPTYDDDQLDRMESEARQRFPRTRSAWEGLEINLLGG